MERKINGRKERAKNIRYTHDGEKLRKPKSEYCSCVQMDRRRVLTASIISNSLWCVDI